jgi:SOS response regulatory protein OraA/RecX
VATGYDKAVQLLATRPHFRRELEAKLRQRGFPGEEIDEVLNRLTEAREAAEEWTRRGGRDPRSLARHLDRKGFSRRAIVAILTGQSNGELDIEDEP